MKPQHRSIKYGCDRDPTPRCSQACIRRLGARSPALYPPTGVTGSVSKNTPDLGAPLRNRTVDLLLTMEI